MAGALGRWALAVIGIALAAPASRAQSTNAIYGLFRGQGYLQYTDSATMADPNRTAFWECWVRPASPSTSTSTSVTDPTDTSTDLIRDSEGERLVLPFPSMDLCRETYPDGAYHLFNVLAGVERTVDLTLPAGGYPAAPLFTNVASLMNPASGQALNVAWQALAGATANDVILVTLEDLYGQLRFHTPWPGQSGVLAGTNTQCTIPARYLVPTTNDYYFFLRVHFVKVSASGGIAGAPGSTGIVGFVATTTVMMFPPAAPQGADVAGYRLLGGKVYQQALGMAPVAATGTNAYQLAVAAIATEAGRLTNATVKRPAGTDLALAGDDWVLYSTLGFATEAAWSQAMTNGAYVWTFDGLVQGRQVATQIVGVATWPAAPQVLGLAQLQGGAFTNAFAIQWQTLAGGSADDLVEVAIADANQNTIWRYPDPAQCDGPLTGADTSVMVPAGQVIGGRNYEGRVRFIKVQARDTIALSGALGVAGRFAETRFPLATQSARPMEILTTNLVDGEVGIDYFAQLASDGGRAPFAWAVLQGGLPRGVRLNATNGLVSGIPAQNGTFAWAVKLSDATGLSATQSYSLVVTGTVPPLEILTTNMPALIPGIHYFVELAIGGGVPPYQWTLAAGRLPAGVELLDCCGFIAGKPTESGSFTFQLQLEDGAGQVQRKQLSMDVPAAALLSPLRITNFIHHADGRVSMRSTGETNDPYTVEVSDDLVLWQPRFTTNLPASGLVEWLEPGAGRKFYRLRFGHGYAEGDPIQVQPSLNTNRMVSLEVGTNGATMKLTNGAGVIFTLTLPTNAVLYPVTVTMTLVEDLLGQPYASGFYGGVELQPEGFGLFKPGLLSVAFPAGPPADFTAVSYRGKGREYHLDPAWIKDGQVVIPIQHFSGHGGAQASQAQAANTSKRSPCMPMYQGEQAVGEVLRAHYPEMASASDLWPPMKAWYNQSVLPNLKAAEENEEVLDAAIAEFLRWSYLVSMLGLDQGWDVKCMRSLAKGMANAINKANTRCVSDSKLEEISTMLQRAREASLLGLDEYQPGAFDLEAVLDRISRCARFELVLESIVDVDGGKFFEQVRSQPAHIQWNPSTLHYSIADSVGVDLIFWHLDSDGRVRPETGKGSFRMVYLNIYRDGEDEPAANPSEPCAKPSPNPQPPKIFCFFAVSDPIRGMSVLGNDGVWHFQPLTGDMGGRWQPLFKIAHLKEFSQFPDLPNGGNGEPVDGYGIREKWDYFGKRLYARATYDGPINYSGGKATETTTLELRHAPKPLRKTR